MHIHPWCGYTLAGMGRVAKLLWHPPADCSLVRCLLLSYHALGSRDTAWTSSINTACALICALSAHHVLV